MRNILLPILRSEECIRRANEGHVHITAQLVDPAGNLGERAGAYLAPGRGADDESPVCYRNFGI
jgi:hypothetical protein